MFQAAQRQRGGTRIEVNSEVKHDAGDIYPYDAIAETAVYVYEKPSYYIQIVRHIAEEDDVDKSDLIHLRVFKLISRNATKQLRV